MRKRGITPLIATVILLGFAIAIIIIVILFTTDYVKDLQEKQGAIAQSRLECATDISFSINNAEPSGASITITLENLKEFIDAFYIVVRNGQSQQTIELEEGLETATIKDFTIEYNPGSVGTPEEIDIIPRIKIAPGVYEACSGQHEVYELA
ncbi:MAG: hypothetical protein Q7R56_01425 [Nanoarchaeota archaeon]|nr:hypothetical protein [Nanoarchaeota archaeon]